MDCGGRKCLVARKPWPRQKSGVRRSIHTKVWITTQKRTKAVLGLFLSMWGEMRVI